MNISTHSIVLALDERVSIDDRLRHLAVSFPWNKSPQGHQYWHLIRHKKKPFDREAIANLVAIVICGVE
jgi:hypothetical protein